MDVPEESHDGLVGMNHSNKDKRPANRSSIKNSAMLRRPRAPQSLPRRPRDADEPCPQKSQSAGFWNNGCCHVGLAAQIFQAHMVVVERYAEQLVGRSGIAHALEYSREAACEVVKAQTHLRPGARKWGFEEHRTAILKFKAPTGKGAVIFQTAAQ